MSIIQLQRRIQEAGRIRIGQKDPGRGFPKKLDTFRLTSQDRTRIEQAAGLYGGRPAQWDAPGGKQWEVITETNALDVIVPPSEMSFSQWYELWSGGGCQRRCDGVTEQISDSPCICDAEERECKPHTRLSVMIRDLPGLGVWRIDSQGYYAAVELEGAVQVIAAAAGAGTLLPARLRLEQRQVKRPGQQTRNFAVPVLDIEVTPAQLLGGQVSGMTLGGGNGARPQVGGGLAALPAAQPDDDMEPPALLTPVPPTVQERPAAPIAQQVASAGKPTGAKRAGASAAIPRTGLAPRTAAQAAAGEQPERGEPEGVTPVDGEDLEALSVDDLRDRIRAEKAKGAQLKLGGNKDELIARLTEHYDNQPASSTAEEAAPEPAPRGKESTPGAATTSGSSTSPEAGPPAPPPPDDELDQPPVATDTGPTEGQRKKLFAVMREHGITEDQRKAVLKGSYEVDSLNDLTSALVARLIDYLERPDGSGVEAFKQAADGFLAGQRRERMAAALRTITPQHARYPAIWERMTALIDDPKSEAGWAQAPPERVEALVLEVEALAAEVEDE